MPSVAWQPWPSRSAPSATPSSRPRPRPSPTSTARRSAWSTRCSPRCTAATTAWRWPPRRSACRSRSSCGTSATSPTVVFNPEIVESDGEWVYEEGCLSIPGLYVEIVRPKQVLLRGHRPRRQRGRVGGRRARGADVPARARPPPRRADVRPHDARPAPRGAWPSTAACRRTPAPRGAAPPAPPALTAAVRLAFLGTPEMAVPPLRALVAAGHDVALVVTRADRRRGRGERDVAEPGQGGGARARPGRQPRHRRRCSTADAELGVVVAYGRIIKPHVLAALPMVNVHFSLLPRWRGAAPVERALLAGDDRDRRLHHGRRGGPRHRAASTPAARCRSGRGRPPAALRTELVERRDPAARRHASPDRCRRRRRRPASRRTPTRSTPAELRLDWSRPAVELDRVVRVGGAWTTFRDRRLKVHDGRASRRARRPSRVDLDADAATVGTGEGGLRLLTVQPEGKAADVAGPTSPTAPTRPQATASAPEPPGHPPSVPAIRGLSGGPAADPRSQQHSDGGR